MLDISGDAYWYLSALLLKYIRNKIGWLNDKICKNSAHMQGMFSP